MKEESKEIVKNTFESVYKLTVGQLPLLGPVFNELAFDYSSRLKQERLNSFLEKLQKSFEIYTESFNKENILNEDFHDILELVLKKVTQTRSEGKIDRYKQIIIGQYKRIEKFDMVERFAEVTERLTDMHIIILESFYSKSSSYLEAKIAMRELSQATDKVEAAIKEINKELRRLKDQRIGHLFTREERKKTNDHILELENSMDSTEKEQIELQAKCEKINHQLDKEVQFEMIDKYDISKNEYNFLTNDLSTMFLIEKNIFTNFNQVGQYFFTISEFGDRYMEFIKVT